MLFVFEGLVYSKKGHGLKMDQSKQNIETKKSAVGLCTIFSILMFVYLFTLLGAELLCLLNLLVIDLAAIIYVFFTYSEAIPSCSFIFSIDIIYSSRWLS